MTTTTILFRGKEYDVDYVDHGYESDTNAHTIDWGFTELSPEQHDALNITDAEHQAIHEKLTQIAYDYDYDDS